MLRFFSPSLIAVAFVLCIAADARAQEPTEAQRDAIRASCRSDFIANCSGVQPGTMAAVECLKRDETKLSASCKTAINAIAPATAGSATGVPPTSVPAAAAPSVPAAPRSGSGGAEAPQTPPAAAQSQDDQLKIVRQACTIDDFTAHCSWIAPNNPELLLCLKGNAPSLSPACQQAVQSLAAGPAAARPAPAAETSQAAPAPKRTEPAREVKSAPQPALAASAQTPSAEQLSAIRASCRADFMAHCPGVQPGGPAALKCLKQNAARVSAPCQTALAAIGQAVGKGSAAATPATSPAAVPAASPAVAPLGPMPPMRPREALAILRLCNADQQALCPGVPVGGGRVLSCLAGNAAALSPSCYAALSAAARR
jgi:hypothetical protein